MSVYRLSSENELAVKGLRVASQQGRIIDTHGASVPLATGKYPESRHRSKYTAHVDALCREFGISCPEYELQFHTVRKYRFDAAWREQRIALELEGGIWMKGGAHALPSNIIRDMEKGNLAVSMGWRVLRYMPDQLTEAVSAVKQLMLAGHE